MFRPKLGRDMDAHAGKFVGDNVSMREARSMQVEFFIVKVLQIEAVFPLP